MNKWLLQAPQARCGMSHVAPWSLLVLLRSWKPWLKSTKYQIPSGQEVYKPESWFRHFYCGQVYLQWAYNCSLGVWWCYRSVQRWTALKNQITLTLGWSAVSMKDLLVVCVMLRCSYYWFWFWFCGDLGLCIFVGLLVVLSTYRSISSSSSDHVMMVVFVFSDTFSSRRMGFAFCFGETTTNAAPGHTHNSWVVMVSRHIIGMVVVSLKRKTKRRPSCEGSSITAIIQKTSHHGDHGDENATLPRRAVSHIMLRMQWIELNWGGQQEMAVYGWYTITPLLLSMFFWAKTNRRIKA